MAKRDKGPQLPKPDDRGDYWLGSVAGAGPAIVHSTRKPGKWLALPKDEPVLTDSGGLRYFDTPEDALRELAARGDL